MSERQKDGQILSDIWSANASRFMGVMHTSQKRVLHPTLAMLVNEQQPTCMLDYGCGDTRILDLIDKTVAVDVHDINAEMLEFAKRNNGERIGNYYQNRDHLPAGCYDAVLLSMVLVCIGSEKEYLEVLQCVRRSKKEKGRVYIAVTHPCFRDRTFSNFHTSYGERQPFKYLKNGEPFDVFIEDEMPPSVAFTDYHWTFSFTLNAILQAGMTVERVIETPDDSLSRNYNDSFSPYLIIVAG
jgi:SAM-dependent methyltransferase